MKIPKFFRFTFCVLLALNFACKKKKESLPEQENTPVVTPSATTPTRADGYLTTSYSFYFQANDSITFPYAFSKGVFYKQSHLIDSFAYLGPDADVGNVLFNDKTLIKEKVGSWISYKYLPASESELEQFRKPMTWTISGNESYKEMQFANNYPVPEYEKTSSIPDSIFKFKDNTIKIGKYKNADEISVSLSSIGKFGSTGDKVVKSSESEITFTPSDFINFSSSEQYDYLALIVTLRKTSYKKIEGKTIQINSLADYESYMIPFRAY